MIAKACFLAKEIGVMLNYGLILEKAGLSHLRAISGLHMGLFCFGVYLIIRLILVTDLKTAAYFPHHKLAAIIALFSGLFYLMLAHHPISAIRAYMMAVVILMAILR